MTTLLILSIIILMMYLSYIVERYGIPNSISDTYYLLGGKPKGLVFQGVLTITAFLMIPVLVSRSSESTEFLAFLACAGLLFVAAAPLFRDSSERIIHIVSAFICCGCLILWQIFNSSWIIPLLCVGMVVYPATKDKKYTWWLEIATMMSIYVSLIFL